MKIWNKKIILKRKILNRLLCSTNEIQNKIRKSKSHFGSNVGMGRADWLTVHYEKRMTDLLFWPANQLKLVPHNLQFV